jgi:hypothetical protein
MIYSSEGRPAMRLVLRHPPRVFQKKLSFDAVDAHSRKWLTMTLFAAIPFSALVLENNDLLAFALCHDLAVDGHAVYLGLADLDIFAIGKYKDFVESDRRSDITGDFFNP